MTYRPVLLPPPQDHVDVGTSTRQSHLHGVAFPIDQDALHALQQLGNKELAYVRLVSFLPSPSPFPSSPSDFLFPPYPSPSHFSLSPLSPPVLIRVLCAPSLRRNLPLPVSLPLPDTESQSLNVFILGCWYTHTSIPRVFPFFVHYSSSYSVSH